MAAARPADVRVYLFTYRRNHLLPRALKSLLAQTHTNWVCELHNDDPSDPFPARLMAEVNDPRISYVGHERNLGPTATFNHLFQPVAEPFVSLLEDDNWWEPELLARLLSAIEGFPGVNLAWANCHRWRETDAGEWERAGTIWPLDPQAPFTVFATPDPRQVCGALHSNGAMILRVTAETMVPCPGEMPVFAIEPIRERVYPGALLLIREPLANFALTRETWRTETADENLQVLVLLAETFLARSRFSNAFYRQMWTACRGSRGHQHRALVVGAFLAGRLTHVLRNARLADLPVIAGWALRHPIRFARLFRARRRFPEVAAFLQTAALRAASHG
ncbi:MAG: glycosyltransferase family 2 protein [Vicinamibacterales bacterium]